MLQITISPNIVWAFCQNAEESEGKDRWTRARVLPSSGHSNLLELISIETHTRKDCLQLTENQYGLK